MEKYKVLFRESAAKELDKIPRRDLRRIVHRIQSMEENPRPAGSEKLSGTDKYRQRQENYRIFYSVQDAELTVYTVKIGHRREVYR